MTLKLLKRNDFSRNTKRSKRLTMQTVCLHWNVLLTLTCFRQSYRICSPAWQQRRQMVRHRLDMISSMADRNGNSRGCIDPGSVSSCREGRSAEARRG